MTCHRAFGPLLAPFACTLGIALSFGCSASPTAPSADRGPTSSPTAAFALAYRAPAESPVERAQTALRAAPDDVDAHVRLAEALLTSRRQSGEVALLAYARDALRGARHLAPEHPAVLRTEAHFLMEEHRFAQARDKARAALSKDPRDTGAHLLLSDALVELGAYDEAAEALQAAMDLEPDLRSYSRTAYLRWLHGDNEGAIEAMDAALQFAGTAAEPRAWCLVELGWLLWHDGRIDAADAVVTRALALVPAYLPALALTARIQAARGEVDRAIATLTETTRRQPTATELSFLSELLARTGRSADAAAHLAAADQLAAHDPLPLALHHARHGIDPDRALELARAAHHERDTVFTQDALALALLRLGRVDEAQAAIDRALRLGTPDPRLTIHRGLIALAAGDAQTARSALERAQQQNPHADPTLLAELRQGLSEARP
ncbi:tetratricopeptide repeat protein [Haliangium sp.]|uniref:tetratricopeptide repeat protein n=1 Tax=Haliangium sp. TaxID=2663208 RepID=UPI003D0F574C